MWTRRRFAAIPALPLLAAEPSWRIADKLGTALSAFTISPDGLLACADAARLFLSRDGFSWQTASLPSPAVSLAFAGDAILIATADGLHRSTDAGKTWNQTHRLSGLTMVAFADAVRGFATGSGKTILQTEDGGESWQPCPAAAQPSTNPETTTYHWIHFVTPRIGVITGASRPLRKGLTGPLPAWRDPKHAQRRPEWPGASLTLETRDGGVTWKHSATSLFGKITRVRYSRDGHGIALVEFHDRFDYPSEVFSIDLRNGTSERAFRRTDRAVTDLLLFPGPQAILAAIEPPQRPEKSSLGAVRFLESSNLKDWTEQDVPEILAGRLWLAGSSVADLWAATDNGVVLRKGS